MEIVDLRPAEALKGLARCRRDLGLSQSQAAELAGVSRRRLQQLETKPALTPAAFEIALTYLALRVLVGGPLFPDVSNGREAA